MTKQISIFIFFSVLCMTMVLQSQDYAIKTKYLVDPDQGEVLQNQTILIEDGKITEIGAEVAIPDAVEVIDLGANYVLPGLVDAHDHLAITYKQEPESNYYYLTTVMDGTPIRAIQAFSTGFQKLASGFTVVRDLGNAGNYADSALRIAIEQGWVPGPTLINSGIIIGGMGGQFWPTPERAFLVYPEYLDADTHDEIIKAVRQNILYGAKVIKIMVDSKPYGYTADEMKLFITEAAKAKLKVAGHVQTRDGALRAIEAGIWSIEHSRVLDDEIHKLMAQKGIWRVGTETPQTDYHPISEKRWQRTIEGIKNAYQNKVKMAFSTDADYFAPGLHRGEITINFLKSWKAAEIPAPEILKIMTNKGYEVCDIIDQRGPIKVGFPADIIAVSANPLEDIDALRDVQFVMKDGMVFKKDGVVTPMNFFHSGPEYGWRKR
jgi:imidazolonepropionase-like amidohydrolase